MQVSKLEEETAVYNALDILRRMDRKVIATYLIDTDVLCIMAATSKRSMTVSGVASVTKLPSASCYKMVDQMEGIGLMACCGSGRVRGGKSKASIYLSVLKELRMEIKNSVIGVSVVWKNGETEEFRKELVPLTEGQWQVPRSEVVCQPAQMADGILSLD